MRAYGVNTYIWVNTQEKRYCVKYHMIPVAGTKTIDRKEAIRLAGDNPNIAGEDLYKTLAGGKTVEYDFCVQLIHTNGRRQDITSHIGDLGQLK